MRASVFFPVVSVAVLVASSAGAHFKLQAPVDRLVTDDTGDPAGVSGTQKMNPCGDGDHSGLFTRVHAGAKLHVKLTETIAHGGHYRIAVLPKWGLASADIPEPKVTLVAGQCGTADVMSPVVPPVVADNLFPHTQAAAVDGQLWETDIDLPSDTGQATLQIIEFMTPHSPQCFYHHCAELDVVDPSTDLGADGFVVLDQNDGGASTSSSGGTTDAGAGSSSGAPSSSSGGCAVGGDATPSLVTGALGVGFALAALRRRRASGRA